MALFSHGKKKKYREKKNGRSEPKNPARAGNTKKFEEMQQSFSAMKEVSDRLQKENESLKQDKQFLLGKLKKIMLETGEDIKEAEQNTQNEEDDKVENAEQEQSQELAQDDTVEEETKIKKVKPAKPAIMKAAKPVKYQPVNSENEKDDENKPREILTNDKSRYVETPLDELLNLIMKKGKVSTAEAAKAFHVTENQIEEWGRVLEEHDLIEIHYPTIGKPILRKKY